MKHSTWVAAFVAGSAILLFGALAIWLLWNSDKCSYLENTGWASAFVVCRSANEVGDFLAGFFAPLATILLGLAVYLQSREMAETREVFQEQRDLMKAQISEAKRSADLFQQQNELLNTQEAARLRREKVARFQSTLELINTGIKTRLIDRKPLRLIGKKVTLHGVFQTRLDELPIETTSAIGAAITSALIHRAQFAQPDKLEVYNKYGHREGFEEIARLCDGAVSQASEIGDEARDVAGLMRLSEFSTLLRAYLSNGPGDASIEPDLIVTQEKVTAQPYGLGAVEIKRRDPDA